MQTIDRDAYSETRRRGAGCLYGLLWLVVTGVAFFISDSLGEIVETSLSDPNTAASRLLSIEGRIEAATPAKYLAVILGGLIAGAVLGIGQGLVLLPYLKLKGMLEWVLATTVGRAARWIAMFIISQQLVGIVLDRDITGFFVIFVLLIGIGCIAGIILGYAQNVVLRRRSRRSELWVWANIPGPVAASILIGMSLLLRDQNVFRDWANPISAAVTAVATTIALLDVLNDPTPQAEWRQDLRWKQEPAVQVVSDTVLGSTLYGSPQPSPQGEAGSTQEDKLYTHQKD